jgi:hypothetical protein
LNVRHGLRIRIQYGRNGTAVHGLVAAAEERGIKEVAAGSGLFELIEELLFSRIDKEEGPDRRACGAVMEG